MMLKIRVAGNALPNIPWEERPDDSPSVVWRYSKKPIIGRNQLPNSNSIFNSAVVPFKGKYAGVFRCDDKARRMNIHCGMSEDGLTWNIEPRPILFASSNPEILNSDYKYDPRVTWLEDRYYITWCNGYHGPTIGLGYTYDFKEFFQLENIFMPFNRNGVLFPRKIKGKFAILSRPSDRGHTPFGDIFYSESPDMTHWGCHRFVMGMCGAESPWQSTKIGAGPIPIETTRGWLLFYHGVLTSCNGFVYSMGAVLLDLDEPWKVLKRTRPYLLAPQMLYECVGDVPNVVFPCATVQDPESGRIAIYYGAADTVVALAFSCIDKLLTFIENNSL